MEAPFRGKGCLVCGGEVMHYQGRESKAKAYDAARYKWMEDSPARKLLEARHEEWAAEIEAVELPADMRYRYMVEHEVIKTIDAAEEHFRTIKGVEPMKHFLLSIISVVALSPLAFTQVSNVSPTKRGLIEDEVVREDLGRQLDTYLAGLVSKGFSGAAMVVRNNKLVLSKGYGTADRGRARPATHRTLFHIGSVTKQFTGAAILKLEMEGKLLVSDPITKYFKDVPPDKQPITIHHLLTHTSGLPHQVGQCSSRLAKVGRDDYVKHVLSAELGSPPGQVHSYSNDGYGLLGSVIEIVSGEPYEQYLRKHLFAPAGMRSTGYSFTEAELARAARGYQGDKEFMGVLNPAYRETGPAWCIKASGGILSTAEDMYKWYLALRGTRILSAQAKDKLFHPHVPEQPERTSFYGYGWALFKTARGTKLIAHNGGIGDHFYADFRMYVDDGVAYFIAGNAAELSALDASEGIAKIIFAPPSKKATRGALPLLSYFYLPNNSFNPSSQSSIR